jgi:hypothetical protein
LVALPPVWDLLLRAKHLFDAAMVAITSAGRVNDDQCDRFSREFKVTRPKADSASILRRRRTFLRLLREAGAPSWIGRHRLLSQAARLTGTPW